MSGVMPAWHLDPQRPGSSSGLFFSHRPSSPNHRPFFRSSPGFFMAFQFKKRSVLPGFGLTFGYTIFYLSLIVLIPVGALFLKSASLSAADFWATVTEIGRASCRERVSTSVRVVCV